MGQIADHGGGGAERQMAQNGAEHPPLAQTAPDIPGEEQDLHGRVGILGIGAHKAPQDLVVWPAAESADGGKEIHAVLAAGAVGKRTVFGIGLIGFVFQIFQHGKTLLQIAGSCKSGGSRQRAMPPAFAARYKHRLRPPSGAAVQRSPVVAVRTFANKTHALSGYQMRESNPRHPGPKPGGALCA